MRAVTALAVGLASAGALTLSWVDGLRPPVIPPLAVSPVRPPRPTGPVTPLTTPRGSAAPSPRVATGTRSVAPRPTTTGPAATPRIVEGPVVQTQYGSVQVAVHYARRQITDVVALHLTDSSDTSVSISAGAAPQLRQEALAAQSARIDQVSGATFTSEAYVQSLQAALDAAHL